LDFFADFLFETNTGGHRNEHHDHPDGNGGHGNFDNRRRNTAFIIFGLDEAFGYEIFKIQESTI